MVKNSSSLIYSILFSIISVCLVFFILSLYVRSNATDSNRSLNRSENAQIILKEDHIQSTQSDNLESKDKTLYIFGPGRYHITGSLKDGQIIVDATSEDSITLEFENVTLHNETSAPIWIKQADEVILEFSDGTSNHFSDGATRTESPAGDKIPEACIYARCDLIIHAANSELSIEGNYKEGIHSSDDLSFEQGSIDIQARSTAIKGHDSFTATNSDLHILAAKDGIYSTGPVNLQGSNLQIHSGKYGIFARECIEADSSCQIAIEQALSPLASNGNIHCDLN